MSNIKSKRHNNNEIREKEEIEANPNCSFPSSSSTSFDHGWKTHTRLPKIYTKRTYRLKEFKWFGNDCVDARDEDCSLVESVEC